MEHPILKLARTSYQEQDIRYDDRGSFSAFETCLEQNDEGKS